MVELYFDNKYITLKFEYTVYAIIKYYIYSHAMPIKRSYARKYIYGWVS